MKVKLLKEIQKLAFAISGDDLGKHYDIFVMDVDSDTFSNFELVEVAGNHVLFKKSNCTVRFDKNHDSDTTITFREWGTAGEWHSLYNMKVVNTAVFNVKDIQVGHDYKIEIDGQTIIGCVDSVQPNSITIVYFDLYIHASTHERDYVLKRLVLQFPHDEENTERIKLTYRIFYESDMHPVMNEKVVFADDITIKEI